jgi:hypothetical protein
MAGDADDVGVALLQQMAHRQTRADAGVVVDHVGEIALVTPAQTPAEIQKDIGQLTNEYGSKCNTAEKQKTQECTDIEKEINYLTKEYVQTSLEKKVDEACDTEKSNKSACIAALNEVVKSECGKDEVSSACSAAKSELAKQQEKGSGQSPQSGEGTMDLTKECPFLYDNKDNPIDKGDSTKINNAYFISTVNKQTNKKYYLFGTIYTKSGSFDATQTTFSSEKSKLTKVADSGYCCIKKRTKPRNAPLTTCQNRLEVNGPIYKASGQSIEFVK